MDATPRINRHTFPELNHILWDNKSDYICEKYAFEVYEKRWAYINKNNITSHEQHLIERLTQKYGQGLLLIA